MTYTDDQLKDLALDYTWRYAPKRDSGKGRTRAEALAPLSLVPVDHIPEPGERVWFYATGRIRPGVAVKMGRRNLKVYHSTPTTIAQVREYVGHDPESLRRAVKTKNIALADIYKEA